MKQYNENTERIIVSLNLYEAGGQVFMFSKRAVVHFPELATKFCSCKGAYNVYCRSCFYEKGIKPEFHIYSYVTKKIRPVPRSMISFPEETHD